MSPEPLFDIIIGHWKSRALSSAFRANLFELLKDGPMDRSCVAAHLKWPDRSVAAIIDACIAIGLLKTESNSVRLTPLTDTYLVRGRPKYLGDWVAEEDRTFADWVHLFDCLTSGRPVGITDKHGYYKVSPEGAHFLDGVSRRVAADLCASEAFYGTVLDLGGGSGAFAEAIVRSHPSTNVILVDQEVVCVETRKRLQDNLASERIQVLSMDFFVDKLPSPVDAVLLANVLHDWSEEQICALLRRARKALRTDGKIVIVEVSPSNHPADDPVSALLSLSFCLSLQHGFCYHSDIYLRALRSTGFAVARTGRLVTTNKLLIVAHAN